MGLPVRAETDSGSWPARPSSGGLLPVMGLAALGLALLGLWGETPPSQWIMALFAPDATDPRQMAFHHALLPRIVIAPIAGAILGLAGVILQQVLRNPLADPTTLGVSAGAHSALVAATLFAPALLDFGRDAVALCGGAVALACVFAAAGGRRFSPLAVILAGLLVSLFLGAGASALVVLNHDYLTELFIWQSGSLLQSGWANSAKLAIVLMAGGAAAALMARVLSVLDIQDGGAKSLGVPLAAVQSGALFVALLLSTTVVASLGVLGFIGLAAPALARRAGARTFGERLTYASLFGAATLSLTDQIVQILPLAQEIPTGVATAVIGAALLLGMSGRTSAAAVEQQPSHRSNGHGGRRRPVVLVCVLGVALAVVLGAIFIGRDQSGWRWSSLQELSELWLWRAPRAAASFAAGSMLGMAGVLMQRLTGNPMAAPEILGISAGASIGLIVLLLVAPTVDAGSTVFAASLGAALALAGVLLSGMRSSFASQRLVLTGVSVATLCSGLTALAMASGDPRLGDMVSWMAGSTHRVTPSGAALALTLAALLLPVAALTARWLDILPLGTVVATTLGLSLGRSRLSILLVAATATASATLIAGPLTFIGLMAPHLGRLLGFRRVVPQLVATALIGGGLMLLADWIARVLIFPWQLPTGIVATLLAGPFALGLLRRAYRWSAP
ncbi:Fe(3+)-hydroxamate ABC transporter permease FhuB [Methylopila musalis]|uniref:Fe(3+)-hydroxamate ABC transporter permease FhuB n=1 Tax=Methylopila musalis TaxID=1134781 RepID=A0ABW3Z733_9HYPH